MRHLQKSFLVLLFSISLLFAGKYGEHKQLGDEGFRRFIEKLVATGSFKDKVDVYNFLQSYLDISYDEKVKHFVIKELSGNVNKIGYGDLTGLAGDHESDPLRIHDNLKYQFSKLNRIVYLHSQHLQGYELAAPDKEIVDVDFSYLTLAVSNFCHFYDYGRSFQDQVNDLKVQDIRDLSDPKNVERIFATVERTHLLRTYLTLHIFAVDLARKAGLLMKDSTFQAMQYLKTAFLFNSYADHFIQDAFSSGHLVVNRSIWGSFINNKAMHDFYGDIGLEVFNLKGGQWKSYGDGSMDRRKSNWRETYTDVQDLAHSENYELGIEATALSLTDLWTAFEQGKAGKNNFLIDAVPEGKDEKFRFCLNNFSALRLIPIPYNTPLKELGYSDEFISEVKPKNDPLWSRAFVRSRVANSVLLIRDFPFVKPANYYLKDGIRLYLSGSNYFYTDKEDKKGTVDHWFGFTGSVSVGHEQFRKIVMQQYKLGVGYNLDYWAFSRRHLGVYSYLEAGLHREKEISSFIFSPAVGVQLGALLGLDQLNLPEYIWLPVRIFILPLKMMLTSDYIPHRRPGYNFSVEIDLVF